MESRPGPGRHAPITPEPFRSGAAILACALAIAVTASSARANDAGGDALVRKANREAYERMKSGDRDGPALLKEVMGPALLAREAEVRKRVQEELKENARLSRERAKRAGKEGNAPASRPSSATKHPPQKASAPPSTPDPGPAIDASDVPREIVFDPTHPSPPASSGSRSPGSPPPAEGGVEEIEF